MTLESLVADKQAWLESLRLRFEKGLGPTVLDTPSWRLGLQYGLRLIENGLEYAHAAQRGIVEYDYVRVAITLGQEMSHSDDDDNMEMILQWGMMNSWYARAAAEMLEHAETLDEREGVISTLLVNWGAFYSRLNLSPTGDQT